MEISVKTPKKTIEKIYFKPRGAVEEEDVEENLHLTEPPRLGRRDSEPHSAEVTYIRDVLTTNFENDRTMWDLHHYFDMGDKIIDLVFDVSYFRGFKLPQELPSYNAADFDNRVPDAVFNVLSPSTYLKDIGVAVDYCRALKIKVYIVFSPYDLGVKMYSPPFLRAYILKDNGQYEMKELRECSVDNEGNIIPDKIVDLEDKVPFNVGLEKRKEKMLKKGKKLSLFRLIIIDKKGNKLYSSLEKERRRAEEERRKRLELERKLKELMEKRQMLKDSF